MEAIRRGDPTQDGKTPSPMRMVMAEVVDCDCSARRGSGRGVRTQPDSWKPQRLTHEQGHALQPARRVELRQAQYREQ
ncbi:MAG: hypothetical protein KatS3mg111_1716 [Pirellulaceae bacterium]|nr:MAG: hypothetical protein KatS3mg111_1716 [Pirellulaceae bacterium]